MHHPFKSLKSFKQQFNQGIYLLADKPKMGTFILCLANASHDSELFDELKSGLKKQYHSLLFQYQAVMQGEKKLDAAEEDILVFLKIQALGFDEIEITQQRKEGEWLCQFNQLRSFRPRRMSEFQHSGEISVPFVDSQFHFNKPFMAKECFWSGKYQGKKLDLFYNKYPFADLHGLMVPERDSCLPQLLIHDMHRYIWDVTSELSKTLPGVAHGYNSYGAYASVNHLHFQMFVDEKGLPVTQKNWKHNGGEESYPMHVMKCADMELAWEIITDLHYKKLPYNLLYMPNEIYILPRKVQGSVEVPQWSSGFTWYELCGAMLLFDEQHYNDISAENISALLSELSA